MTAAEAAFKCGTMTGGRLASIATQQDLDRILAIQPNLDFWIGTYRNPAAGEKLILSDGRRQFVETSAEPIFVANAFDR